MNANGGLMCVFCSWGNTSSNSVERQSVKMHSRLFNESYFNEQAFEDFFDDSKIFETA